MFADTNGSLVDGLGIRHPEEGVALRATYIVDPFNIIQHADVNNLLVGRNPTETLRILDALQTGENCGCNREIGGEMLRRSLTSRPGEAVASLRRSRVVQDDICEFI